MIHICIKSHSKVERSDASHFVECLVYSREKVWKVNVEPSLDRNKINCNHGYQLKQGSQQHCPSHTFDSLIFDLSIYHQAVVMTGNLVDCCEPGKLNEIGTWHKPWFFKHVQGFFETGWLPW